MVRSQRRHGIVLSVLVMGLFLLFSMVVAQESSDDDNPLAPFAVLIGGQWHLEDTYQEFIWGPGKMSVNGRSYQMKDGEPTLVGEGFWFYHPGEQAIKGYFVGTGMGVDVFDYTTRFEDGNMLNDLTTYGDYGGEWEEVWEFTGDDTFVWTLYQKTPDGPSEMMSGTYQRKQ